MCLLGGGDYGFVGFMVFFDLFVDGINVGVCWGVWGWVEYFVEFVDYGC